MLEYVQFIPSVRNPLWLTRLSHFLCYDVKFYEVKFYDVKNYVVKFHDVKVYDVKFYVVKFYVVKFYVACGNSLGRIL